MLRLVKVFGCALVALCTLAAESKELTRAEMVARYNYVVGIHTIGSQYQFTEKTRLIETADIILGMGSNIIKFNLGPAFGRDNYAGAHPGKFNSLVELAEYEPSIARVFDMPFYYYFLWVNPMAKSEWQWRKDKKPFSEKDAKIEYQELYDLTCYLLEKYSGSGKSFYLGHWEGDWLLLRGYDRTIDPEPWCVQNMIHWLNLRQKAVDDAKHDTPHHDVAVFHYTEVNLVIKGMNGGPCLTTEVLPHVNVDFVSYSAYDAQANPEKSDILFKALNFIKKHLPEKKEISGPRVFIGEFGYKGAAFSPEVQCRNSIAFIKNAVTWGCPFVLYWQLYDNEFENGRYEGYWLIDDKGVKQPVYYMLEGYYRKAREYLRKNFGTDGTPPAPEKFIPKMKTLLKVTN
ncbi:MAG: hypothetical protein WC959_03170 [Kiritimatiellales bacterium]